MDLTACAEQSSNVQDSLFALAATSLPCFAARIRCLLSSPMRRIDTGSRTVVQLVQGGLTATQLFPSRL